MKRFASVIFTIDTEEHGIENTDEAVTELLREKLNNQPFPWELEEYSLEESIGTETDT